MSEGYKQQTAKTVPSCELGEYWEERFRTLIICTSGSLRKFLALFKAILIVFAIFQGTLPKIYFVFQTINETFFMLLHLISVAFIY